MMTMCYYYHHYVDQLKLTVNFNIKPYSNSAIQRNFSAFNGFISLKLGQALTKTI